MFDGAIITTFLWHFQKRRTKLKKLLNSNHLESWWLIYFIGGIIFFVMKEYKVILTEISNG